MHDIIQRSTDLLFRAKQKGLVDVLADNVARGESDEIQETLRAIQALGDSDCLISVKLLMGDGSLVDHVGTVVGVQSITTIIPVSEMHGGDHVLSIVVSSRPQNPRLLKIAWIGLEGAGKTSLLHRFKHGEYQAFEPTVGLVLEPMNFQGHELENLDMGCQGQEKVRRSWISILAQEHVPDVIMFVFDSTTLSRYASLLVDYLQLLTSIPQLVETPILIAANKQDSGNTAMLDEIKNTFNFNKLLEGRKWELFCTSARTGIGIDEILYHLLMIIDPSSISIS